LVALALELAADGAVERGIGRGQGALKEVAIIGALRLGGAVHEILLNQPVQPRPAEMQLIESSKALTGRLGLAPLTSWLRTSGRSCTCRRWIASICGRV